MDSNRIAELLAPFLEMPSTEAAPAFSHSEPAKAGEEPAVLSPGQLQHISTYIDILLRWDARINLTAIRDPEEIVTRHFGESLFAARLLFPNAASVGTGGTRVETGGSPVAAERSSAVTVDADAHESLSGAKTAGPGPAAIARLKAAAVSRVDPAAERRQNAAHGVSRGSAPSKEQAPEGRKKPSPRVEVSQDSYQGTASSRADTTPEKKGALAPDAPANHQRPATNDRPTLADLGSGAGFPGLPIKLWAPQVSLTLIESNHKKATFLREVTRALTLTDVNILTTRAEHLANGQAQQRPNDVPQTFNVVTLRAVEHFEDILPIAATMVTPAGRLALLIGSSQLHHARATLPFFLWQEPVPVPRSKARTVLIGTRTNPSPS